VFITANLLAFSTMSRPQRVSSCVPGSQLHHGSGRSTKGHMHMKAGSRSAIVAVSCERFGAGRGG